MKKKKSLISTVFIILISVFYIYSDDINKFISNINKDYDGEVQQQRVMSDNGDNLSIYYLDVGQADSTLIKYKDSYILIDAGNNEDGEGLVKYFNSLGIDEFKYVFGTHAHEDHIGGMDDVIRNFKIDKFYMPDVVTTTKTFEDVVDALEDKNVRFNTPKIGDKLSVDDLELDVLYVGKDEADINNTSIVLKVKYKDTSYLFMGDAEGKVEKILLNKDIKSDVLKVGHHGSQYSSTATFLNKVQPSYAVIEVGKNNIYNHPKEVTLSRLEKIGAKIYRTDLDGTVLLTSDGKNINFEKIKTDIDGK